MIDQADFARALLDPERPTPADFSTWNGSDPTVRLAVYRNNVMVSLLGVLADTFPVTRELVGEAFFHAMGQCFVRSRPPQSPVMAEYGAGFADFIAGFAPAGTLPYLPDVARLEWLRVVALHAGDAEPLPAERIAALVAEQPDLGAWRLRLHPSFAVLRSDYAAVSIWAAHQGAGNLAAIDPDQGESAWIVRPDLEVTVIPIDSAGGAFAAALLDGLPLAAAIAAVDEAGLHLDLPATLAALIRARALISMQPPT